MAEQSMQLEAEVRDKLGKGFARKLRAEKRLPGEVYGPGLKKNISVSVDEIAFNKLFKKCSHHVAIDLLIGKKKQRVIVKAIDIHPIKRSIIHVDFLVLKAKTPFVTKVPLKYEGTPVGVKAGGTFFTYAFKLQVRQLPEKMVEFIAVDVSALEKDQYLIVRDVVEQKGVEVMTHEGDVIVEVK